MARLITGFLSNQKLRSLLFKAAMVAACAVFSCGAHLAASESLPMTLSFSDVNGHLKVEGSFFVDADPAVAWGVLTDYSRDPRIRAQHEGQFGPKPRRQ